MSQSGERPEIRELLSIRDWLRYGVSRFHAEKLVFGHGTASALDEAAFLILHTLSLPIDDLEPWIDARLTVRERLAVLDIIDKRISSRKPAPYIVGEAWIGPYRFSVDERVIVPRSYIGELMISGFDGLIEDLGRVERVLDLCTGSGCLAILAAQQFPDAIVDGVDISRDALDVARDNVADYGLSERVELVCSDMFEKLVGRTYDLIISNPPYVTDDAVAAFPKEFAAEPILAHAGGADGLDFAHRIMRNARQHLSEDGCLIVEVGQARDALEAAYPNTNFFWASTETSDGEVFTLRARDLDALTS